jgi:hypothetical protein
MSTMFPQFRPAFSFYDIEQEVYASVKALVIPSLIFELSDVLFQKVLVEFHHISLS